jgi:hypothetical protein
MDPVKLPQTKQDFKKAINDYMGRFKEYLASGDDRGAGRCARIVSGLAEDAQRDAPDYIDGLTSRGYLDKILSGT